MTEDRGRKALFGRVEDAENHKLVAEALHISHIEIYIPFYRTDGV